MSHCQTVLLITFLIYWIYYKSIICFVIYCISVCPERWIPPLLLLLRFLHFLPVKGFLGSFSLAESRV